MVSLIMIPKIVCELTLFIACHPCIFMKSLLGFVCVWLLMGFGADKFPIIVIDYFLEYRIACNNIKLKFSAGAVCVANILLACIAFR